MFDRNVAQHLACHAAITAPDDEHPLGLTMGKDRNMREHCVIDELVAGRRLHDIVEGENLAEGLVFKDADALKGRLAVIKHVTDPQALQVVAMQCLDCPAGQQIAFTHHHLSSICADLPISLSAGNSCPRQDGVAPASRAGENALERYEPCSCCNRTGRSGKNLLGIWANSAATLDSIATKRDSRRLAQIGRLC